MPVNIGALVIFGGIEEKWSLSGGLGGPLGKPLTNETPTFDGVGRTQAFQGGTISWHPSTGAHIVWGAICDRWVQLGRENFGYPITDELTCPDGIGKFNHFRALHLEGTPEASIYWTARFGAHEVYGGIREKWSTLGFERGVLGYPVDAEQDQQGGGRIQSFVGGVISWHPRTGAFLIGGGIFERWVALGRENFGYPVTDELTCPDGIGKFNHFRALHLEGTPDASIYWSPASGVHEVYGGIREYWASLGWEQGRLGYPVEAEHDEAGGGRAQTFQRGALHWHRDRGVNATFTSSARSLQFRLRYFAEHESNDGGTEGVTDEVWLAAIGADSTAVRMGAGGQPLPQLIQAPAVGDVTLDSVRNPWTANPYVLLSFDGLDQPGPWPRSFTSTLLIVEHDHGDLAKAFEQLNAAIGKEIRSAIVSASSAAADATVGAAVGSVIPGFGKVVGAAIGAAAAAAFDAVVSLIAEGLADDIFKPIPITLVLNSPHEAPGVNTTLVQEVREGSAHYSISYDWHLVG